MSTYLGLNEKIPNFFGIPAVSSGSLQLYAWFSKSGATPLLAF